MSTNPTKRIEEIDRRLEELPKGTLTYKKINGKEQPYIQRTIDGKSVSYYVKVSEREQVFVELEERTKLLEEKKHLSIRMDGELHNKLQFVAAYEGRSMSRQILYLINQCVREFEKEHGPIRPEDLD